MISASIPRSIRLSGLWVLLTASTPVLPLSPTAVNPESLECRTLAPEQMSCTVPEETAYPSPPVRRVESRCELTAGAGDSSPRRSFERCGRQVLHGVFEVCRPASGSGSGCGLADLNGEIVLPTIYQRVRLMPESSMVPIQLNDRWGYFDLEQREVVLPTQFARVTDFREGLAFVQQDPSRSSTGAPVSGWIVARDGTRVGEVVTGVTDVAPFAGSLARARLSGRWGFLDRRGHWAIAPQFFEARDFKAGFAMVRASLDPQHWTLIDRQGRGVLFLEGLSHRLKLWTGTHIRLEYACEDDEPGALRRRCQDLCLTLSGEPGSPSPQSRLPAPLQSCERHIR